MIIYCYKTQNQRQDIPIVTQSAIQIVFIVFTTFSSIILLQKDYFLYNISKEKKIIHQTI